MAQKKNERIFCETKRLKFERRIFGVLTSFCRLFAGNVDDRLDTSSVETTNSTVTPGEMSKQKENAGAEREKEQSKTTSTTTPSPSPILAFKVTFPPRPSSTLPPPPPTPTFLLRRFPTSRPTARPTAPTTPPRSFNSKFNKPAINNLVGVPAPFATGIQS